MANSTSSWVVPDATNVTDATPMRTGAHPTRSVSLEGIFELSSLTDDDFRKIAFLLTPYLSDDDCSYVLNQNIPPNKKMQYMLMQVRKKDGKFTDDRFYLAVCELLYLIKQYRLLKLQPRPTRMCLHQAKLKFSDANNTNIVPKSRRFLFKLCESLDDAEVGILSRQLFGVSDIKTAEDLMNQIISESKLDALESAFADMGREDLSKLIQGSRSYRMERLPGKHCGLAVVFNNNLFKKPSLPDKVECPNLEEREGTNVDAASLHSLWNGFGLEVQEHTDVASYEILPILDKIAQKDFPMDVFVCCILSHGDKGLIYGSDRVAVPLKYIYHMFGTSKKLEGIPKLFFIQACQGQLHQEGLGGKIFIKTTIQSDGPSATPSQPLYSDMLIGVSTIPWFVSFRSSKAGSMYVQHLVRTLEQHWETHDINEILTIVNRKVAEETVPVDESTPVVQATPVVHVQVDCKQMPTVKHQLRSKLYFKKGPE